MVDDLDEIRAQLSALGERIDALEHPRATAPGEVLGKDAFWALEGLKSRLAEQPETEQGTVMLVGTLQSPTGAPVSWQQAAGTAGLIETDWADRAATFAALGHPARLEMLRLILSGVQSTAQLAETEVLSTTGQLHHHLRQLVAAGWVRQSGRGAYEVPAARVVPLLASMLGAER